MCGQLGYSGVDPFNVQNIKTLIYINALERGDDATGIYSPLNGLKKDNIKGWNFVTDPNIEIVPDTIFMGHVRSATVGNNTCLNAHPFERGNCVLQHNGTLKNHWDLLKKYDLKLNDYNVDSDCLAGIIDKCDSASPLKEIDGAAAVIFHDKRQPDKLFVFRNAERPLFRGHIGPNMYISSIKETLEIIGCINIKEFKENMLYTIDKGLILNTTKVKNKPYKSPIVVTPITTYNNYETNLIHHCNVRASYNITLKNILKRKEANIIKGLYYEVIEVINGTCVKIYDKATDCDYITSTTLLNTQDDVIKSDDYIITLSNLHNKSNSLIVKEATVCQVTTSYHDGTVSLKGYLNGTTSYYFPKEKLRKLTNSEKEAHLKSIETNPLLLDSETSMNNEDDTSITFHEAAKMATALNKSNVQIRMPLCLSAAAENSTKEAKIIDIINPQVLPSNQISMSITDLEDTLHEFFIELDNKFIELKEKITDYNNEDALDILRKLDVKSWELYTNIYEVKHAKQ